MKKNKNKFKNKNMIMSSIAELITRHPDKEIRALLISELEYFKEYINNEKELEDAKFKIQNVYVLYYKLAESKFYEIISNKNKTAKNKTEIVAKRYTRKVQNEND